MKRNAAYTALFFGIVAVLFSVLGYVTSWGAVTVDIAGGRADLTGTDLQHGVAIVRPEGLDYYPNVLLTPEDFAAGQPQGRHFTSEDLGGVQYGTYRTVLRLPAGRTYALRAMAINFSQRIFIGGVEHEAVGYPADNAAETVPAARTALYVFTPEAEETEIILQYANFVYRGGGAAYPLYVSEYGNLIRGELLSLFRTCVVSGCLVTIFLFYCGMYLFFRRRPYFLAFAVSCLAIALRSLLVGEKFLTRLWPDLGWAASMRLEYWALAVMVAAFILYLHGMYPGLLHRKGLICYMAFSALFCAVVAVTEPRVFSRFLLLYQALSVPYGLYIVWRLIRSARRKRELETVLVMAGGGLFLAGIISDAFLHSRAVQVGVSGLDQPGMMIFIFANMIALAVRFSRTERELAEMSELSRMKTEFLNRASHDLKTPVAAMDLALQRLEHITDEGERGRFLAALHRNQRDMAAMVANLLHAARLDAGGVRYDLKPFPADALCARIQDKYEDGLELGGIALDVSAGTSRALLADEVLLWSVLDNLVYNAARYTPKGGTVQVSLRAAGGGVALEVRDSGPGIPQPDLPHIFERGFAAGEKGGTGMGLYIVSSAMEGMGGTVEAANVPGGGAAFTLVFQDGSEKTAKKEVETPAGLC